MASKKMSKKEIKYLDELEKAALTRIELDQKVQDKFDAEQKDLRHRIEILKENDPFGDYED